jgi:hypothetical protein
MLINPDNSVSIFQRKGSYQATPDELAAIDNADRSGVATEEQVAAAFSAFRIV